MITSTVVLFKEFLWGIAVGFLGGILFVLPTNFNNAITKVREGNQILINLNKDLYLLNKSQIKEIMIDL